LYVSKCNIVGEQTGRQNILHQMTACSPTSICKLLL